MSEVSHLSSLTIPPEFVEKLRSHQIDALHFLWRKLVDDGLKTLLRADPSMSLADRAALHSAHFGCTIGHSMGLGKTVTALAFLSLLQAHVTALPAAPGAAPALRVLVLAPRSCTLQWQRCAAEWAPALRVRGPQGSAAAAAPALRALHERGGVLVLGYEEFQRLLRRPAPLCARVPSALDGARPPLPRGADVTMRDAAEAFDVVVLDEAHRLKRVTSRLVADIATHCRGIPLRIALTGTPLQNHLEEFNVMHAVVTGRAPDPAQFRRLFVAPIERGRCADSTFQQFRQMQKCVASLRRFFEATVHHCGPEVLEQDLPPRQECVIFVRLSPQQEVAYRAMLERRTRERFSGDTSALVFELHHEASHICCHPSLTLRGARALVSLNTGARCAGASRKLRFERVKTSTMDENSLGGSDGCEKNNSLYERDYDDDDDEEEEDDSDHDDELDEELREAVKDGIYGGGKEMKNERGASGIRGGADGHQFLTEANALFDRLNVRESPKLAIVLSLVRRIAHDLHEKVVVFSTYRSHLFLLQRLLQSQAGITGDILHGALTVQERQEAIEKFSTDTTRPVLLCSTRAGGVGVNLVAANHCVLMDVSWNPADDTQATYRVYRYGQRRPVSVYRIATEGTFEHVVFFYALSKSWMHRKIADVVDPTRRERHMRENYFTYPCALPIGAAPASEAAEWVKYASQHCPALALTAPDGVFTEVRSIVEHSFLLRDDTDEAIRAMSNRFKSEQRALEERVRPRIPTPLCIDEEVSVKASTGEAILLSSFELALRRFFAEASATLLARDSSLGELLCAATGVPLSTRDAFVVPVALFYTQGLDRLLRRTLSRPAFAQLRAQLQNRAGAGQSADAALATRPITLFASFAPAEAMYVLTELGLTRPIVPHCIITGARFALRQSAAPPETFHKLLQLFQQKEEDKCIRDAPVDMYAAIVNADDDTADDDDDDDDDDANDEADRDTDAWRAAECVAGALARMWPPLAGIACADASIDFSARRRLAARAYAAAQDATSAFLTVREAAALVGLTAVPGRNGQFFCRRCTDALLAHAPPSGTLRCARCHYSAESDVQTHAATRHAVALFQFSTACGLIGRFAVARSLAASFSPGDCRDVSHALRQLSATGAARPSAEFVRAACAAGLLCVAGGLPRAIARRVALQCGCAPAANTTALREWLREALAADSSGLWRTRLRAHTRRAADEWICARAGVAALPEAFLALALREAAEKSRATHASDVLDPSLAPTAGGDDAARFHGSGDALLRFVCDALVTLRFVERLLRAPPELPPRDESLSGRSGSLESLDGGSLDSLDGGSLDGSVASVARRARRGKRRRSPAESFASSFSAGGSSFSSCYSDDGDSAASGSEERASEGEGEGGDGSEGEGRGAEREEDRDSAGGAKKRPGAEKGTAAEEVRRARIGRYWAAYCEVYGTRSVESLTLKVEDEGQEMVFLPPPPNTLWVSDVRDATRDGLRLSSAVEEFMERIIPLAASVRVIK